MKLSNNPDEDGIYSWWGILVLAILALFCIVGKSNAQTISFNTFNACDSTGISETTYANTEFTISDSLIYFTDGVHDIQDEIAHVEKVSNSKRIIYTHSDKFILIGFKDSITQIKWIPHYGGVIVFFNSNIKR